MKAHMKAFRDNKGDIMSYHIGKYIYRQVGFKATITDMSTAKYVDLTEKEARLCLLSRSQIKIMIDRYFKGE